MPSTKSYRRLHEEAVARPGASERLDALREDTPPEIGLYELRRALDRSQTELAAELGISQSAISHLERAGDVKLSTLRNYLRYLGARLELLAVFEDDDEEHVVPILIGGKVASRVDCHGGSWSNGPWLSGRPTATPAAGEGGRKLGGRLWVKGV
ncbi:MAG: helix-turn-helix transcriptional regulator [Actinobacteria bacterium]|nr:helix-turn-helix transcriptional regulator [Actinomycetota bacterium]